MIGFSEQVMESARKLFCCCDRILEEDIPDGVVDRMEEQAEALQEQSRDYRERLLDQERNSRSDLSRKMASLLLAEDTKIEEFMDEGFSAVREGRLTGEGQADMNVGALYVEYLTGRALQSMREALIGAMNLKVLARKSEQAKDIK